MDVKEPVVSFLTGNPSWVFKEDVPAQNILLVGLEFEAYKVLCGLGRDEASSHFGSDRRQSESKGSL